MRLSTRSRTAQLDAEATLLKAAIVVAIDRVERTIDMESEATASLVQVAEERRNENDRQ